MNIELSERERAIAAEVRTKETVAAGIVERSEWQGAHLVEYQPGNGTRYVFLFTPLEGFTTAGRAVDSDRTDRWAVSDLSTGYRTIVVGRDSYLDPWYLAEKLDSSLADAVAIGELCSYILGCGAMSAEGFAVGAALANLPKRT